MFYKKNNERSTTKVEKIERDGSTCKRPRGKGKGAASKPKPIHKEPGTYDKLVYLMHVRTCVYINDYFINF